jgi:para-nitrobenzyl esterase
VIETLGIRFARAARFEPPQLLDFDGSSLGRFGDACPQPPGEVFMTSGMPTAEDCLFLNVWTPSLDGHRPVMVWIHGGGYRQGSGDHLLSRGQVLAERGDVVVVTLNYRLGVFGFLGETNVGLLDQQCALQWVRANIASFGGDPTNITLFGESAGAGSVGFQLTMPSSAGLFERAVMQSGAGRPVTMERADRLRGELVAAAGKPLLDATADELVAAQLAVEAQHPGGMTFLPSVDGTIVVDGAPHHDVPLVLGSNVDEWRLMGLRDPHRIDLSEDGLRSRVGGDDADGIIDAFRAARAERGEPVTPSDVWFAIQTDRFFRVPALQFADEHAVTSPVFTYLFGWRSPMLDGWAGACHVLEIPFVFGLQGSEALGYFTGEGALADALSADMMRRWVSFARGKAPWSRYDTTTRPTMCFGAGESTIEHDPRGVERDVLSRLSRTG